MNPQIRMTRERKLVGKRIRTTLANNKTVDLWKSFMPRRKEIKNNVTTELFSIQVYDPSLGLDDFSHETTFEKWAAIEVAAFDLIPGGMEALTLPQGLYAVFLYKGAPSEFSKTFEHICKTWLPASGYELDNRPHFEIMGEKYKNEDPDSEEEIWIPVKEGILR